MIDTTAVRALADKATNFGKGFAPFHGWPYQKQIGDLGAELRQCAAAIDALHADNVRLRAALMRVGDDYPGSSCQQWCYEQVGIAPMIDHAPDPLHVKVVQT